MSRIHPIESFAGLAECELVIETITEELESKRDIFEQLDRLCGPNVDPGKQYVDIKLDRARQRYGASRARNRDAFRLSGHQDEFGGNRTRSENFG